MSKKFAFLAAVVVALILGFTGPSWAVPVANGLADAARYIFETHLVMIMDGQNLRFGCL